MTVNDDRVDVRLDLALSLLQVKRKPKAPVLPAVFASAGLAASAVVLAATVILGAGGNRPAAAGPVIKATEAPAAQSTDNGNATFELSASRDGLKGNVAATKEAITAGSEGAK
jgi:hypothetical protein